jgi:hypothetical protein
LAFGGRRVFMADDFLIRVAARFPTFARRLGDPQDVEPPASDDDLFHLQESLGVSLPDSYKDLLRCAKAFSFLSGVATIGRYHYFPDFEPFDAGSFERGGVIQVPGGWPPPSKSVLHFGAFSSPPDAGDLLFDARQGLLGGEYPILYCEHISGSCAYIEAKGQTARTIAGNFPELLDRFFGYEEFQRWIRLAGYVAGASDYDFGPDNSLDY